MSGFNISLTPSRWASRALLLTALWPPLLLALTPMPWWALLLATPLLLACYSFGYRAFQQLQQAVSLALNRDGSVYWFDAAEAGANTAAPAQLCRGGLVSQWALRLNWQIGKDKRTYQRWIFADQCSSAEFRALARAINQQNWQQQHADNNPTPGGLK